jgi:hypothetical protein
MEPIQPNFNDEYMTHVHSNEMVNLQQTFVCYIWRTPFGRDLYEKFNFIPPPFGPPTFIDVEAVLSGQTINRPIKQIVNTNTTSVQFQTKVGIVLPSHVKSTLTVNPIVPLQPQNPYILQNRVGTPSHHRVQNLSTQQNPTAAQLLTGGIPPFGGHIPTRGKPSFQKLVSTGGQHPFTSQTPVFTQPMEGGQSSFTGNPHSFTGNPPPSWGPPQGGMFHQSYQGGTSNSNPQGGIPNTNPSKLHSGQPFQWVSNPNWGPQGQQYYPPEGANPYPPQGQPSYLP